MSSYCAEAIEIVASRPSVVTQQPTSRSDEPSEPAAQNASVGRNLTEVLSSEKTYSGRAPLRHVYRQSPHLHTFGRRGA